MGTQLKDRNPRKHGKKNISVTDPSLLSQSYYSSQSQRNTSNVFMDELRKIGIHEEFDIPVIEQNIRHPMNLMVHKTRLEQNLFLQKMKQFCGEKKNLQFILKPTKIKDGSFDSDLKDSILCILFRVSSIQPTLGVFLLEQIGKYQNDRNMWDLLHKQIRMPEHIVLNEKFFQALLDSVNNLKGDCQSALVSNVGELVVGYDQHDRMGVKLVQLMNSEKKLVRHVLKSLALLHLTGNNSINQIRDNLIEAMTSYAPIDMPDIVGFLLKTCDRQSIPQIILSLRSDKLDLFTKLHSGSFDRKTENRLDVAVLKEFRRFFQIQQPAVINEAFAAIASQNNNLNKFDLLFISIGCQVEELDSIGSHCTKSLNALYNIIPAYNTQIERTHVQMLSQIFIAHQMFSHRKLHDLLIEICMDCVKSSKLDRRKFGCLILQCMFVKFDCGMHEFKLMHTIVRKKCMEVLLDHALCPNSQCDEVVNTLDILVTQVPQLVAQFTHKFKDILNGDELLKLPLHVARRIFNFFMSVQSKIPSVNIPDRNLGGVVNILDEMDKFVSRCRSAMALETKQKCVGIVAAACMFKIFKLNTGIENWEKRAMEVLKCMQDYCFNKPMINAIYLEELSLIRKDHPEILGETVVEPLVHKFKETYLTQTQDVKESYQGVDCSLVFGDESEYCVNLMSCVFSGRLHTADMLVGLLYHKQLIHDLQVPDQTLNLLQTDVVVCDPETIDQVRLCDNPQFVRNVASLYFHGVNWFRELLSNHCEPEILPELCNRLIKILEQIVVHERYLMDCLAYVHRWAVPVVWCLSDDKQMFISGIADQPMPTKRKKATKTKPAKKKNTVDVSTSNDSTINNVQGEEETEEEPWQPRVKVRPNKDLQPSAVHNFMTYMNIRVHALLEHHAKLGDGAFLFLLRDLNKKLDLALPGFRIKKTFPIKRKSENTPWLNGLLKFRNTNGEKFVEIICVAMKAVLGRLKRILHTEIGSQEDILFDEKRNQILVESVTFLNIVFDSDHLREKMAFRELLNCIHKDGEMKDSTLEQTVSCWKDMLMTESDAIEASLCIGAGVIRLCMTLNKWADNGLDARISDRIDKMLMKRCDAIIKGNGAYLKSLLESRLSIEEDPIKYMNEHLVREIMPRSFKDVNIDESLYQSFSHHTFNMYLSVFFEQVVQHAKIARSEQFAPQRIFTLWSRLLDVSLLLVGVCVIKSEDVSKEMLGRIRSATTYKTLTKYCTLLLKYFTDRRAGKMPPGFDHFIQVNNNLEEEVAHRAKAIDNIKKAQKICRELNQICNHIKRHRGEVSNLNELREMMTHLNNRVFESLGSHGSVTIARVKERDMDGHSQPIAGMEEETTVTEETIENETEVEEGGDEDDSIGRPDVDVDVGLDDTDLLSDTSDTTSDD